MRPTGTGEGLCPAHYNSWRSHKVLALEEWAATIARPITTWLGCHVLGCAGPAVNPRGLCSHHYRGWSRDRDVADRWIEPEHWARGKTPYLDARRFSLAPLTQAVRLEFRYALQQRDRHHATLAPHLVRHLVRIAAGLPTLRGQTDGITAQLGKGAPQTQSMARQICWWVDLAHDEFCGISPVDKDVLDLRAVELHSPKPASHRKSTRIAVLTTIAQPWLRDLVRGWVSVEHPPSGIVHKMIRALTIASDALSYRPGGGTDPAALRFADINAVFHAIAAASRLDGEPYKQSQRRRLLSLFFQLLDFGRTAGLLDGLSGSFARHGSHVIPREDPNEDEIGSALPEHVIGQLDHHLGSLGRDFPYYESWPDELVQAMFRTIYVIFRDTGRRPGEVASLTVDCLETINGEVSLVWNNGKSRRLRRRLPISEDTAQVIREWQQLRTTVSTSPRAQSCLFPAVTETGSAPCIDSKNIAKAIRLWVDALPELDYGGFNWLHQGGLVWPHLKIQGRLDSAPVQAISDKKGLVTGGAKSDRRRHALAEGGATPSRLGGATWSRQNHELHDEGVDASGTPLPFDRSRVYPYAFRHSYAQRHADAGTPVDVLKELMDHASITTTTGYFNSQELHQTGVNLQVAC